MLVPFLLVAVLAASDAPPPAAPAAPLPLKVALARAQQASPMRGAAVATAAGAADAARAAGRPLNPLFDFRTENWTPWTSTELPLDVWLTVTQPIELGAKRALRSGVAAAERDTAAADLAGVDRRLAIRVTTLYMQALRAKGRLDSLGANREGLTTLVDTMRMRVGEGYVAESDLLRFEAEAARLDIDIARATLDLARSLDALAVLIGTPRIDAAQLVMPPVPPIPGATDAVVAAAVARHPEMRASLGRAQRAEQAFALENARRLPDPAVTGGYKRTLGLSTMVAGVTVTVPVFDRNSPARAAAAGASRAAAAERDATQARLASEIAMLARTAGTLADRAGRVDGDLLAPADVVREAARAAFREGSVDVLKVIDAERVHRDVGLVALELRLEAVGSAVEARIALGEDPLP